MYSLHWILMIIQVDDSSVMVWDSLRKNPASYQNLQDMFQE
jgi:Ulp1 family protease